MAVFRHSLVAVLCLGFTGSAVAWAGPAHYDSPPLESVDSPYAAHKTVGTVVRLGSIVGGVDTERIGVTGIGLIAAVGHRFGRFELDSEYTYLQFQERGPSDLRLGNGHRLGLMARYDVLRFDSAAVGPNTMVSVFVAGGAGVAWNAWWRPGFNEPGRIVPADSKRVEAIGEVGLEVEHRLQETTGLRRIGWKLGLRVAGAPHDADSAVICRTSSTTCREAPMMPETQYTDRSMLFESSLGATW